MTSERTWVPADDGKRRVGIVPAAVLALVMLATGVGIGWAMRGGSTSTEASIVSSGARAIPRRPPLDEMPQPFKAGEIRTVKTDDGSAVPAMSSPDDYRVWEASWWISEDAPLVFEDQWFPVASGSRVEIVDQDRSNEFRKSAYRVHVIDHPSYGKRDAYVHWSFVR